jgi:hypothetical protein
MRCSRKILHCGGTSSEDRPSGKPKAQAPQKRAVSHRFPRRGPRVGIRVRSHRCHAVVGQPLRARPTIASMAPPAPRTSIASTGDRQVGSPGLNCRLRLGDVGTHRSAGTRGSSAEVREADKRQIVEEAVRAGASLSEVARRYGIAALVLSAGGWSWRLCRFSSRADH